MKGLGGLAVNDLNFIAVKISERGECSTPKLLLWQARELYASCAKLFVLLMNVGYLKRQPGESTDEHLLLLWRISSDRLNNKF